MKRYLPALFGLIIIGITVWGTRGVNTALDTFLTTNVFFAATRLVIAGILLTCSLLAYEKHNIAKILLRSAGIAFIAAGAISVISPTLFGRIPSYTLILDTLIAVEGGIICVLASLKPAANVPAARTTKFVFRPNHHTLPRQAARMSFHAGRVYYPAS